MTRFFKIYLLPGFVFQSVLIGGGYATGRELIEFFFALGPIGGLLGLLVSGLIFGVVLAAGFEFARVMKAYDYRMFTKALLGRGWVVFEIAFLLQLLLILSVIGSAAGQLTESAFGLPPIVGTLGLILFIGALVFSGTAAIKRMLAGWSFLLYGVYLILFILAFKVFGPEIDAAYGEAKVSGGWISSGVLYSGYNLAILPAVLFATNLHASLRETVGAGLIAGAIAVIPAALFFTSMMGMYPEIGDAPVPATALMAAMNIGWLEVVFQIVVFGTFVETGAAMLHAVNERVSVSFSEQGKILPQYARPLVSVSFLVVSIFAASQIGIVDLIADGYGLLTFVFIAILIIPLMTVGVWKITRRGTW